MKRLKTLRVRFALWTAGLFLVGMSGFGVTIYASMARGLSTATDDSLTLVASQVIAGLEIENDRLILSESLMDEAEKSGLIARGFTVRLLTPEGQTIHAFGPYLALLRAPESNPSEASFTTLAISSGDDTLRVYTAPIEGSSQRVAVVQIARSLENVEDTLQRLLTTLLVSGPLLIMMAGFGGYFLAARALAPMDHITRTARRIAEGAEGLSARLHLPPIDDEVGRMAETFDAMLARLDDTFRRERQFTVDASHELRTPLAAMQAILNVIREKRRAPEEYEQALDDLAEETDRLRTLTENLLRLARGDTDSVVPYEVIDLSTLLRDVSDSLQPLAEAKGLTLACGVPDGLTVLGDSDGLIRLFVNLLDNAIKFTERGGVTLSAGQNQDRELHIVIADTGIGISAEHLPQIFDRFYRVDQARTTSGAGLGLALASEIARAHGGGIEVASAAGKGTRFTVILPKQGQRRNHAAPQA
ncbi:MAG TPA: HAMP domain-containing sensor histidine kinase [Anaerolineales bacterium]|nr:HAMP domain-containing sensor histidine kinase [Anaerolineales bacterium]